MPSTASPRAQPLKKASKRITSVSKPRLQSGMTSNQAEIPNSSNLKQDPIILTTVDKEDTEGPQKNEDHDENQNQIENEPTESSERDEDLKKDLTGSTEGSKGDEDLRKHPPTECSERDKDKDQEKDAKTEVSEPDKDQEKEAKTECSGGDQELKKDAKTEASERDKDQETDARTKCSEDDQDLTKERTAEGSEGDQDQEKNRALLDDRKCAICQEIIIDACRVSCGHTFCRFCIDAKMTGSEAGAQRCTICDGKIDEVQNCPEVDKEINRLISILSIKERLKRAGIKAERQRQQENKKDINANNNSVPPDFENRYETPNPNPNSGERHNLNFQEPYQYYDYEGNVIGASSSDSDSSIYNYNLGPYAETGGAHSHQFPNHASSSDVPNSAPTAAPTQPMMLHETVTFHRVCMVQPDGSTDNGQNPQSQPSGNIPPWNPNSNNTNTSQSHDYCYHQHSRPTTTPPPRTAGPTQPPTYYAPNGYPCYSAGPPLPCNFYYQPQLQPYYAYQSVPYCSYPFPNYNNYGGSQNPYSGAPPHQAHYDYYGLPVYTQPSNDYTPPAQTPPMQPNNHNHCNFYESCSDNRTVTVPVQLPGSPSGTTIPVQVPLDLLVEDHDSDDGDDYLYGAQGHYEVPQYGYAYQEDQELPGSTSTISTVPIQVPSELLGEEQESSTEESHDGDDYLHGAQGHYVLPQYDYNYNNCQEDRSIQELPGSTSGTSTVPVQAPLNLLLEEQDSSTEGSYDGEDYLFEAQGHYGVLQCDYDYDYQEDRSIQGQNFSQN